MLKVSETSSQGAVGFELRITDYFLPRLYDLSNKVNGHDNNRNEKVSNTHSKGERVKIPLLPNREGKRSRTMTMVKTIGHFNHDFLIGHF